MARGALTTRYRLTKFAAAVEDFWYEVLAPKQTSKHSNSFHDTLTTAYDKFLKAVDRQMTTSMYIAGTAMCPNMNKKALEDQSAVEKLIVRNLPRPSSRNVLIGDVIAFNSPLGQASAQNVLVRRVAAVEGDEMVSDKSDDVPYEIPKDHCWVLADNSNLKPPDVIDSRTFGHVPFCNIIGRVIYAATSCTDHGPVANNPESVWADQSIIEAEVDLEAMFPSESSSS